LTPIATGTCRASSKLRAEPVGRHSSCCHQPRQSCNDYWPARRRGFGEGSMGDNYPSVLCADGDPEILEQLKEHFTLQGFIVLTASNGVEACLQVKRWAPKAVILDLMIPRLGGIGTLSRIRTFNPNVPVILVSDTPSARDLAPKSSLGPA